MSDLDEFDESGEEEDETLDELGLWTGSKSQTIGPARTGTSKTEASTEDVKSNVKSVATDPNVNAQAAKVQSKVESKAALVGTDSRNKANASTDTKAPRTKASNTRNVTQEDENEDTENTAEIIEIDTSPSGVPKESGETQTPTEPLSFEDPRLFDLGPDEVRSKKAKPRSATDPTQQDGQEEYEVKMDMGEEEKHTKEDQEEKEAEEETGYVGEEEEELEEENLFSESKLIETGGASLNEFENLFMKPSDTCALGRLSMEALNLESRQLTPSPPASAAVSPRINKCPSIESFFKLSEVVAINFHVLPGQKIYGKNIRLDRTIAVIKEELSRLTKVPARFLELRRNKNLVMDYKTLKDCGGKPGKRMKFTVELSKRALGKYELRVPEQNKIEARPELARSVQVHSGKAWKTVKVVIEYPTERKVFIGGYRHKVSKIECHHAWTQTAMEPKHFRDSQTHKACQAFNEKTSGIQTSITTYTQVDRPDYFVSCQHQRLIRPRPYVTAAQKERLKIKAVIVIQSYWRRWLAIREREARMNGLIKRVEWAEAVRKGRTEIRLAIKDDELYRQYNPKSLNDIELLYRAINLWRKEQVDYIIANRWGAEKKAALADVIEKEADLLLDLERAKNKILEHKGETIVEDLFKKMGSPSRWLTRTGHFVTVDTPEKAGARALYQVYQQLSEPVTDEQKRLDLLHKVYDLVKNHHNVTCDYLVQLMGREITLMQRKARKRLLVGLRQRITNTFFHVCQQPTFNPESRILQRVPFDMMKLRKDMVQCKSCRRMLYRDQFTISRGVTVTSRCLTCIGLYRRCILRADMNLYRRMLQELRHDEQEQGVESSITYIIDAFDLQFLIEDIWHGQSALSGISDRYLLRICRWIKNQPWTPWNCVLLTEEESVAHLHIDDMQSAYQPSFFEKVRLRHNAARGYFQRTAKIALGLDPALKEQCADWNMARKEIKKKLQTRKCRNCAL